MPQLDKVTFLSQFFWLCFFYLGFYYLLLKFYLPQIGRIVALRQKKMGITQQGFSDLLQESQQEIKTFQAVCSQALATSKTAFLTLFSKTNTWVNSHRKILNKTNYKNVNASYFHYIAQDSLSQNVFFNHASFMLPDKVSLACLVGGFTDFNTTKGAQGDDSGESKKVKKVKK